MKELVIVGSGGFGREVLQWAKDVNKVRQKWLIKGFIDDNMNALDGFKCTHSIIGRIEDWNPSDKEVFACAIANPPIKEAVVAILKSKGCLFTSIIHPTAVIGDCNEIGEGLIAYPNSYITSNAKIGDFVSLLSSGIGHDAVVGDYSTISSFCDIPRAVRIGKGVFLGSHVTIVPCRKIGNGSYLGAGSVVIRDVKDNIKVFGNPARKIPF